MRAFKTAVAISALSAALGACAMDLTPRPQYPVRQEPAAPPPAPAPAPAPAPVVAPKPVAPAEPAPGDDAPPAARPTQPVQSAPLPPPPKPGAMLEPRSSQEVMVFASASGDATVTVGPGDTLAKIARKSGVSVDDLIKANKLDDPGKLKLGQKLNLPGAAPADDAAPAKGQTTKAKGKAAKAEAAPEPKAETLKVGKGDTLRKLAQKAGVSVEELAKANDIAPPYRLKLGQTLTVPGSAASDEAPAPSSAKAHGAAKAATTTVTVGQGDTFASIARKAGVSQAELAKLNHLKKPYRLLRGQKIKLPSDESADDGSASSGPPEALAPYSVTVGKGQTLQSIAEGAGVPIDDLARLNHIRTPYKVRTGQKIKMPADASAASSAGPAPRSQVTRAEPPRTIVAKRHETLQSIADRAGVPVSELARLNHLKKPYRVKAGQKIRLSGRPAVVSAPTSYTVKRGDTLYSIARQFGTDAKTLADANGLDADVRVKVGRRLQLPGGPLDQPSARAERGQPAEPVPYTSLSSNPPTASAPGLVPPPPPAASNFGAQPVRPAPQAVTPDVPTQADADVAAAGRGLFQWPVRGSTLSSYGPKPGGQRNDGLDIGAAAGDPVHAAAAGEIVYAGNSVPGFGNLVLIRHDGGWVTVYAHLSNIDVKMRQTVTQGQQIGEVGQTGGVDQPQLHFEVRYAPNPKDKARQIDPALVLPQ